MRKYKEEYTVYGIEIPKKETNAFQKNNKELFLNVHKINPITPLDDLKNLIYLDPSKKPLFEKYGIKEEQIKTYSIFRESK